MKPLRRLVCTGCGRRIVLDDDTHTISHEHPECQAFRAKLEAAQRALGIDPTHVTISLTLRGEDGREMPGRKGEG